MYLLAVEPFLDKINDCYTEIITVSPKPSGALLKQTKRINPPKLSPFTVNPNCCPTPTCIYALCSISDPSRLMCVDEIPDLFCFLTSNAYAIDTEITKMMNQSSIGFQRKKILCFVKTN